MSSKRVLKICLYVNLNLKRESFRLSEVIDEMKDKVSKFAFPRGYALVPVLFHIGGVSQAVYDKEYFYRIIDIADFLDGAID